MVINNDSQWDVIVKLMQQCKWRDTASLNDAFNAMSTAWSRGDDPEMLALVATNFGQISGYTGKVMETMADAVAHEQMHMSKQTPVQLPIVKTTPVNITPVLELEPEPVSIIVPSEKENAWRSAIEQRKVMLSAAKDELNVQIKALRDGYGNLEKQWDEYVATSRESTRKLK